MITKNIQIIDIASQATPTISVDSSGLITASATQSAGYVSAGTKSATNQLTVQAAQTITPGTSNKTIASGRYLTGTQTIKGDANLVASNIVKGKTIFNVTGTYAGANYQVIVKTDTGSTVTATKGSVMKTATELNGIWGFSYLSAGDWTITCSKDGNEVSEAVTIIADGLCQIRQIDYVWVPEFTYTGTYIIVDDEDNLITNPKNWRDNFKIRFLTSGTLRFTNLYKFKSGIDVFCVGGGGGTASMSSGAGGGYTKTQGSVQVETGVDYEIVVGAGGPNQTAGDRSGFGGTGGTTSAFNVLAAGGKPGSQYNRDVAGGDGGSGGSEYQSTPRDGGIDGNNGNAKGSTDEDVGRGQRVLVGPNGETGTTREFGEENGTLYSNGGRAGDLGTEKENEDVAAFYPNSGHGAHGSNSSYEVGSRGFAGASGIVIIRNPREVA